MTMMIPFNDKYRYPKGTPYVLLQFENVDDLKHRVRNDVKWNERLVKLLHESEVYTSIVDVTYSFEEHIWEHPVFCIFKLPRNSRLATHVVYPKEYEQIISIDERHDNE